MLPLVATPTAYTNIMHQTCQPVSPASSVQMQLKPESHPSAATFPL